MGRHGWPVGRGGRYNPATEARVRGSDPIHGFLEGQGVTVIAVPGVGHDMSYRNPEGFASAIAAGLRA